MYEGAPMMYKSIERLNGDPTPLKKLADDYVSGVSAYLALRQAVMYLALQNSEHTTLKEPRSKRVTGQKPRTGWRTAVRIGHGSAAGKTEPGRDLARLPHGWLVTRTVSGQRGN